MHEMRYYLDMSGIVVIWLLDFSPLNDSLVRLFLNNHHIYSLIVLI